MCYFFYRISYSGNFSWQINIIRANPSIKSLLFLKYAIGLYVMYYLPKHLCQCVYQMSYWYFSPGYSSIYFVDFFLFLKRKYCYVTLLCPFISRWLVIIIMLCLLNVYRCAFYLCELRSAHMNKQSFVL